MKFISNLIAIWPSRDSHGHISPCTSLLLRLPFVTSTMAKGATKRKAEPEPTKRQPKGKKDKKKLKREPLHRDESDDDSDGMMPGE